MGLDKLRLHRIEAIPERSSVGFGCLRRHELRVQPIAQRIGAYPFGVPRRLGMLRPRLGGSSVGVSCVSTAFRDLGTLSKSATSPA